MPILWGFGMRMPSFGVKLPARQMLHLQLDHVELALGSAAYRTNPIIWNVDPSGAGREAFIRVTLFLVIDVAAGSALPGFLRHLSHRDRPCYRRFRQGLTLS